MWRSYWRRIKNIVIYLVINIKNKGDYKWKKENQREY